jgi:dTDP-4-amino-4,6-dideoxygalactose transaminase
MLVSDDAKLAGMIARQSWHGLGSQAWSRHHQSAPEYELGALGFNYRFDDPRAALLHTYLERLDEDNRRRAAIDGAYRDAFAAHELLEPTAPFPAGEPSSHCLFTAVLDPSVDRDAFRRSLAERGVQSTVHYPLLHSNGAHSQPDLRLPISEDYVRHCVTLPLFPQMEAWQQELVIEAVGEALDGRERAPVAA